MREEKHLAKRIERLERVFGNPVAREYSQEEREALGKLLLSMLLQEECEKAMGIPSSFASYPELRACLKKLMADPDIRSVIEAEVKRRLPVLRAWRAWYEAHRGELQQEDWINWDWAVSAVYVLRRDGTKGVPEAEALLEAAERAKVGTPEEERRAWRWSPALK